MLALLFVVGGAASHLGHVLNYVTGLTSRPGFQHSTVFAKPLLSFKFLRLLTSWVMGVKECSHGAKNIAINIAKNARKKRFAPVLPIFLAMFLVTFADIFSDVFWRLIFLVLKTFLAPYERA